MNYKKIKNINKEISILGYGCMRFPVVNGDEGKINVIESEKILDYAIKNGINYLDTAWPYHQGKSEEFVGNYIEKRGIRKEIHLATKLPSWLIKNRYDMDKYLNEQLKRLKTDYIDFYLIHALNKKYWEDLKANGIFDFIKDIKKRGIVKHIGFSFHDELDVFKKIIEDYDGWEFTQIQLNYLDEEKQAGLDGLKFAKEKGLNVIIMEPLKGGNIVGEIPSDVKILWDKAENKKSPAQWGLKYLWDKKEVDIVLSGMKDIKFVKENINCASKSGANCLDEKERLLIQEVKETYLKKIEVGCTDCKYCMPCPFGVNIPRALRALNDAKMFEDVNVSRKAYFDSVESDNRADKCLNCKECLEKCPQKINIPKELEKLVKLF